MSTHADHPSSSPPESQTTSPPPARRAFNDMPYEILGLILTLAMHTERSTTSRYRFPSVLCRINRRFYNTVHGTPHLWSCIHITTSSKTHFLHAQDRILGKSGALPLSIDLRVQTATTDSENDIVSLLTKHSNRWKSLSLQYRVDCDQNTAPWHMLEALLQATAPQLDIIDVHVPHRYGHPGPRPSTLHLPSRIPSFRTLQMTNCNYSWNTGKSRLPTSLRSLAVLEDNGTCYQSGIVETIKPLCSSLQSLSLGGLELNLSYSPDLEDIGIQPLCVMESLESLKMSLMPMTSAIKLLHSFKYPNLKQLSLDIIPDSFMDLTNTSLYRRRQELWKDVRYPQLSQLTLVSLPEPDKFHNLWINFLQTLPSSVTTLKIERAPGRHFGEVMTALRHPRANALCRQLEYISAYGLITPNSIISVIDGRCPFLKLLQVNANEMQLGPGNTKWSFERRQTLIDYLKSIATVKMVEGKATDSEAPTFASWEEYREYEARNTAKFTPGSARS